MTVVPEGPLTLASLFTVAGVAAGAVFVTTLVALLKNVFSTYVPALDQNGALLAFAFSAILYVLAGLSLGIGSLEDAFAVFVAWVTCATAAVGVNASIRTTQVPPAS